MTTPIFDAFISYASADLAFAQTVHQRLTSEGFKIWFDKDRLKPGFDWHREIEQGCESSLVMLPILTPRWKQSLWTCYETYAHRDIIPILFEGDVREVMTPPLSRYQADTIDFTTTQDHDWSRLVEALTIKRDQVRASRTTRPKPVIITRHAPNPHFVGRQSKMNEMLDKLFLSPTTAITQGRVETVTALGGVGKTTLANEFAHRYWRLYDHILWVDCRRDLTSEFFQVARRLFPDMPEGIDVTSTAMRAIRTLDNPAFRESCLLILDNAEDEASLRYDIPDPHHPAARIQGSWVPSRGNCHTIITSRFANWPGHIAAIKLDVLDPEPAQQLLCSRSNLELSQLDPVQSKACDDLADALGYLPLALEAAAAYIANEGAGYGFVDYLRYYREAQADALKQHTKGFTDYPESVYTTWKITIDRLSPEAQAMLRLTAWFAATPIPLGMFTSQGEMLATLGARLSDKPAVKATPSEHDVRAFKTELVNYSMAIPSEIKRVGQTFTVHNLTQAVQRHTASEYEWQIWAKVAYEFFHAYAPTDVDTNVEGWPAWEALTPHAIAMATLLEPLGELQGALFLLDTAAKFAYIQARYAEAEPLMRRVLAFCEAYYGKDHPNVAMVLSSLALLLQATNRLSKAEPLMRRTLAIYETSYGKDHPEVATGLNNLAQLLQDTNRLSEAEPLMRRALAIDEASSGKDHPNVATGLYNLALLLHATNRFSEAEPLMRRNLDIFMQFTRSTGHWYRHLENVVNNHGTLLMVMGHTHDQATAEIRRICPELFD